jgi:AcrR family transcriptional regulator
MSGSQLPGRGRGRARRRGAEPYHHGDLPAALLKAAEEILAEKGVDRFTLRECARRAGVSHAAPAHHFGDVTGLLTAMATVGFQRLTASMRAHRSEAAADPRSQFLASGLGYIAFAVSNPQHFALLGRTRTFNQSNPDLQAASHAAFAELLDCVGALHGLEQPMEDAGARRDVLAAWSMVHGYSTLLLEQRLNAFGPPDRGEVEATLRRLFFGPEPLGGTPGQR